VNTISYTQTTNNRTHAHTFHQTQSFPYLEVSYTSSTIPLLKPFRLLKAPRQPPLVPWILYTWLSIKKYTHSQRTSILSRAFPKKPTIIKPRFSLIQRRSMQNSNLFLRHMIKLSFLSYDTCIPLTSSPMQHTFQNHRWCNPPPHPKSVHPYHLPKWASLQSRFHPPLTFSGHPFWPTASLLPLMKLDVPRFDGHEATSWIFKINQFFEYHSTPEEDKRKVASFYMDGVTLS